MQHLKRVAKLPDIDDNLSLQTEENKEEKPEAQSHDNTLTAKEETKQLDEILDADVENSKSNYCDKPNDSNCPPNDEKVSGETPSLQSDGKVTACPDLKRSISCPSFTTKSDKSSETASVHQASLDKSPSTGTSDKKTVKYSIDSPTYQSISEFTDDDYFSGPKNIADYTQQYYGESSGNMSPWSYSPGKMSPHWSPARSGGDRLSPYQSPVHSEPYSPLSVGSIVSSSNRSPNYSPDMSPLSGFSPPGSSVSGFSPGRMTPSAGSSPGSRSPFPGSNFSGISPLHGSSFSGSNSPRPGTSTSGQGEVSLSSSQPALPGASPPHPALPGASPLHPPTAPGLSPAITSSQDSNLSFISAGEMQTVPPTGQWSPLSGIAQLDSPTLMAGSPMWGTQTTTDESNDAQVGVIIFLIKKNNMEPLRFNR